MKKARYLLVFLVFGMISFFISANVYAASYELLFNKDLPIVTSLTKFSYSNALQRLEGKDSSIGHSPLAFIGDNGEPKELKIPQSSAKLALVPAVKTGEGDYLVRSGTGHFFITTPSRNGSLGDVVVYAKRDWRSLSAGANISVDDNIFLDTTKDWRYVYRIVEVVKGDQVGKYLAPTTDRNEIILVVEGRDGVELYRGENISLQNVGR